MKRRAYIWTNEEAIVIERKDRTGPMGVKCYYFDAITPASLKRLNTFVSLRPGSRVDHIYDHR